jgi:hypothetical protein
MKDKFIKNGIEYVRQGDYYIPNLTVPDEATYNIGKYGNLRKRFLKEHHKALYTIMFMNGSLFKQLAEIDETCHSTLNSLRRSSILSHLFQRFLKPCVKI